MKNSENRSINEITQATPGANAIIPALLSLPLNMNGLGLSRSYSMSSKSYNCCISAQELMLWIKSHRHAHHEGIHFHPWKHHDSVISWGKGLSRLKSFALNSSTYFWRPLFPLLLNYIYTTTWNLAITCQGRETTYLSSIIECLVRVCGCPWDFLYRKAHPCPTEPTKFATYFMSSSSGISWVAQHNNLESMTETAGQFKGAESPLATLSQEFIQATLKGLYF